MPAVTSGVIPAQAGIHADVLILSLSKDEDIARVSPFDRLRVRPPVVLDPRFRGGDILTEEF